MASARDSYRAFEKALYARRLVLARGIAGVVEKVIGERPEYEPDDDGDIAIFPINLRYVWHVMFDVDVHEFDVYIVNVDSNNYDDRAPDEGLTIAEMEKRDEKDLYPIVDAIEAYLAMTDNSLTYQTTGENGTIDRTLITGVASTKTTKEMNQLHRLRAAAGREAAAEERAGNAVIAGMLGYALRGTGVKVPSCRNVAKPAKPAAKRRAPAKPKAAKPRTTGLPATVAELRQMLADDQAEMSAISAEGRKASAAAGHGNGDTWISSDTPELAKQDSEIRTHAKAVQDKIKRLQRAPKV